MANETFLTPAQVAARLQLSRQSVYAALKDKELDCIRVGKLIRIEEAAVQRWLDAGPTGDGERQNAMADGTDSENKATRSPSSSQPAADRR